jgi:DNA-binding response OmpR family regulator
METTPQKIMIIDDELDLAEMVAYQFKSKGFDVQTARDGVDALEKLANFKPDLIILDINMPRMGGIEFYNRISGPDGAPLYPIMVLTARANVESLFKDLPIDGFMTKPFDVDELVAQAHLIILAKQQHYTQETWGSKVPKKICLAFNEQKTFDQAVQVFANAMYTIIPARNGIMAIERIITVVPDVAIIDLCLPDISGDVVILRLSQICKTMNIKFLLTSPKGNNRDQEVIDRIATKTGFIALVEYSDVQELLEKVKKLL